MYSATLSEILNRNLYIRGNTSSLHNTAYTASTAACFRVPFEDKLFDKLSDANIRSIMYVSYSSNLQL